MNYLISKTENPVLSMTEKSNGKNPNSNNIKIKHIRTTQYKNNSRVLAKPEIYYI